VVEEDGDEDDASTKLASSIWYRMRKAGQLRHDIDITFTRVRLRHDVTVDNVIECTLIILVSISITRMDSLCRPEGSAAEAKTHGPISHPEQTPSKYWV